MAFTVETGAGLAGANAYLSVADFKTHHGDRGRVITAYGDTAIQAAIVKATDYLDKRFGGRFVGVKGSSDQGLAWPRMGAMSRDGYSLDGIPKQLAKATAEYAYLALTLGTELAPNVESGIIEVSEEVGPIKTTTKYSDSGYSGDNPLVDDIPEYPEADLWVLELIGSTSDRELCRG